MSPVQRYPIGDPWREPPCILDINWSGLLFVVFISSDRNCETQAGPGRGPGFYWRGWLPSDVPCLRLP